MRNDQELPLATDAECKTRRTILISCGVIVPADKSELITKKDGLQVISTHKSSRAWRRELVRRGIIDPRPEYTSTYKKGSVQRDEGHYSPKPIKSEDEYNRRKELYLWMVSDILHTRRTLKLIFGEKADDYPSWYF